MKAEQISAEERDRIYKQAIELENAGEEDVELAKKVSCEFYRKGNHPKVYSSQCKGCMSDESIKQCRQDYLLRIFDHPQECWNPDFDKPVVREKITSAEMGVGLQCDSCYMKDRCPMFQAGAMCAIDFGTKESVDGEASHKDILDALIKMQRDRVARLKAFEEIDGGMTDANLSGEMDRLSALIQERRDLDTFKVKASIEASGGAAALGAGGGGGLLSSIFGSGPKQETKALEESNNEGFAEYEEIKEPRTKLKRSR